MNGCELCRIPIIYYQRYCVTFCHILSLPNIVILQVIYSNTYYAVIKSNQIKSNTMRIIIPSVLLSALLSITDVQGQVIPICATTDPTNAALQKKENGTICK